MNKRGSRYAGYIEGAFVEGEGVPLVVENPADQSVVAMMAGLSEVQFGRALRAARQAFPAWSGLANQQRATRLRSFSQALRRQVRKIVSVVGAESGCLRSVTVLDAQIHTPLQLTDRLVDLYLALPEMSENPLSVDERVQPSGFVRSLFRHLPVGVVAALTDCNAPFGTALGKVVPALLAGNTMLLRPDPLTPLSALLIAGAAQEAELPPGVLNIVCERGTDGERLMASDSRVDMVSFTGPSAAGARVARRAAASLKRVSLGLCGQSTQVFLPDAVERAAACGRTACTSQYSHHGLLGARLLIPEGNKAAVLDQLASLLETVKIGSGDDLESQLGPLASAGQRARCEMLTDVAQQHGGRILSGGRRPAAFKKGYFFEPTLIDVPNDTNPILQEEIAGPIVAVLGYRDLDHAVALANRFMSRRLNRVHGHDRAVALQVGLRTRSGRIDIDDTGDDQELDRNPALLELRNFQFLNTLNIGADDVRIA